jgi:alkane 1-monooxygenase
MLRFQLIQLGFVILVWWFFGTFATIAFLIAAFIGILLLETVNYIEHYGLSRNKTKSGYYERPQPNHSWNSDHQMGRLLLFELSRHSDHHYKASRKYQILKYHDDAPQMPTGYPGMMLLALVPPLWFYIMDPRLDKATPSSGIKKIASYQ